MSPAGSWRLKSDATLLVHGARWGRRRRVEPHLLRLVGDEGKVYESILSQLRGGPKYRISVSKALHDWRAAGREQLLRGGDRELAQLRSIVMGHSCHVRADVVSLVDNDLPHQRRIDERQVRGA